MLSSDGSGGIRNALLWHWLGSIVRLTTSCSRGGSRSGFFTTKRISSLSFVKLCLSACFGLGCQVAGISLGGFDRLLSCLFCWWGGLSFDQSLQPFQQCVEFEGALCECMGASYLYLRSDSPSYSTTSARDEPGFQNSARVASRVVSSSSYTPREERTECVGESLIYPRWALCELHIHDETLASETTHLA